MLLPRTIDVEVLASTWRRPRQMPSAFPASPTSETIDIATVLNVIGVLTTPPLSGGASLSEMWAFVRYFFAVTESDDDLRLKSEFQEMDAHQKTILSDDFGMGFSMHWLAQRLGFVAACDGRYFIENHLSFVRGTYSGGSAKRGLGKSPDFVAMDQAGRFHVVECKGTQSSLAYRNRQLKETGTAQKRTIHLPPPYGGERLVAGLFIGGADGDRTNLRVIDPEPPDPYVVRDKDPELVRNAVARGTLAKQLRSSGFPRVSAAVAYPRLRPNVENPDEFQENEEDVQRRHEQAEAEFRNFRDRTFVVGGTQYVGRRVEMVLPRPLWTKRGEYSRVEVRQGLERGTFEQVRSKSMQRDVLGKGEAEAFTGNYRSGETQGRAWVMFGESYYSEIRLLR
jgi:hypothetical protein